MTAVYDHPNIIQRSVRRFIALGPVTGTLAHTMHHLDQPMLRWTNGKASISTLMTGLPIISLTTTGAKSGMPRSVPIVAIPDGDRLLLIASNWGRPKRPAWYYNATANPEVGVTLDGKTSHWTAIELDGAEKDAAWQKAVALYPGYEAYLQRNGGRPIPVLELRPQNRIL